MDMRILRKMAAVISSVLIVTATAGMALTEAAAPETGTEASTDTAEDSSAVPVTEGTENAVRWDKADISEYDSSTSLISYELTTPEMYKTGDGLEAAEVYQPSSGTNLSAQELEALMKKRAELKKLIPTITGRKISVDPTEVEIQTSGGTVGEIPQAQEAPEIEIKPGQFIFVTYGWGHGVGMSQNSANFYATYSGWTYQDILFHYFPGTYLMNTGLTDDEKLTIAHAPAGDTLEVVSKIVFNEVGGIFSYEAIKAQAVAVYTYIKYNGDDSNDLRGKENPPQIVIDACKEVLGEALYYNGDYALTMFSASSGGCAANCRDIFYQDLPYLRSVPSAYDAAYDPHYGSVQNISEAELKRRIETRYGITLSNNPYNWIRPVYCQETGYVSEVIIDGQLTVKGYPFSVAMGLKSCKFCLAYIDYEDFAAGCDPYVTIIPDIPVSEIVKPDINVVEPPSEDTSEPSEETTEEPSEDTTEETTEDTSEENTESSEEPTDSTEENTESTEELTESDESEAEPFYLYYPEQ